MPIIYCRNSPAIGPGFSRPHCESRVTPGERRSRRRKHLSGPAKVMTDAAEIVADAAEIVTGGGKIVADTAKIVADTAKIVGDAAKIMTDVRKEVRGILKKVPAHGDDARRGDHRAGGGRAVGPSLLIRRHNLSKDYVPNNDQAYDAWLENFVVQLAGNAAQVGLVPADVDPISNAFDEFAAAFTTFQSARSAAKAATGAKVTKRTASEQILRPLVRRINNHPGMTDALRGILGLTQEYLVQAETPVSAMTPLLYVVPAAGQVHVHWGPSPKNERANGKPAGVKGANIYRKRAGESAYQIIGYATKSPFIDAVTGPGADYVYVVRYRGTEQTDLSNESESATIAARGEVAQAA